MAGRKTQGSNASSQADAPTPAPAPAPTRARKTKRQHNPTAIGDAFRAYRLRERTSQQALADLLGCSYQTWSRIELGDTVPNETAFKVGEKVRCMRIGTRDGVPLSHIIAVGSVYEVTAIGREYDGEPAVGLSCCPSGNYPCSWLEPADDLAKRQVEIVLVERTARRPSRSLRYRFTRPWSQA